MPNQRSMLQRFLGDVTWNWRIRWAVGLIGVALVVSAAVLNRLHHRASRTPELSGMRLAEFISMQPIDAHTHFFHAGPGFLGMLDRLHLRILDIMFIDDTNPYRSSVGPERQDAWNFVAASRGRALTCTTFDPFRFNEADFSAKAVAALDADFARGAVAAKIWKNIGMEIKDASGHYVMPDDPRLEPIYDDITEHHRTLIVHAAEPDYAWESNDRRSVSVALYYARNPRWDMSLASGAPQKAAILQARDHLIALHPTLRVVGAHFGSMENHLPDLAERLDRYPNFAVDTAARVVDLTIQPRDRVRAFFVKYQDRILYGTDLNFYPDADDALRTEAGERAYALDWRYFSTDDKFDYLGHTVQGLDLPRAVLKKLYHDNAARWIPGIDADSRGASVN
jgi:hypothetical protein